MANPFLQRATEYIRDDALFLGMVSPIPLTNVLAENPHANKIFEIPVRIVGEPGSGKTMLAKVLEFRMVDAIAREQSNPTNPELLGALSKVGFLVDGTPCVAAVREPMESHYRDFWELPYDETVRAQLLFRFAQSRAILGLIRNLTADHRRGLDEIHFIARDSSEAQVEKIGGLDTTSIRERAFDVQKAIYSIVANLRPPKIKHLPAAATSPYSPFEAISKVEIGWKGKNIRLDPLVIFDDVHALHPKQRDALFVSLAHREIHFGRWLMMRVDALNSDTVLGQTGSRETHNLATGRDFLDIRMRLGTERDHRGLRFRSTALDMANRYLPLMQVFKNRRDAKFENFLRVESDTPTKEELEHIRKRMEQLAKSVEKDLLRLKITGARREALIGLVDEYLAQFPAYEGHEDLRIAMTRILTHRYANREVYRTLSLLEEFEPEHEISLKVNEDIVNGARLHLRHTRPNRPLHVGFDELCYASDENAEVFLQFAGALVARMETLAIRNHQLPPLTAAMQEDVLAEKAVAIMNGWSFAYAARVRKMADTIAQECLKASLSAHAKFGTGVNAIGLLETEMQRLLASDHEVTLVLKHAVANGTMTVKPNHSFGRKSWFLIRLSGTVCLAHGLTLRRGQFLKKGSSYLQRVSA